MSLIVLSLFESVFHYSIRVLNLKKRKIVILGELYTCNLKRLILMILEEVSTFGV